MSEAFISYSRADREFADKLLQDLEERGIDVWIDRESIEGGAAWRAAISAAIRSCRAFILILSPRSTQSGQVSKELSVAEMHNRLIIPVVLESCDIPPGMELQLAELQWISLADQSYEAALDRLTRVITEARSRAAGASTPERQDSARISAPPATPRVSESTGNSGSSRKWLLAGTAAIVVAGASFAAFRYMPAPGADSPIENAARVETPAVRAVTATTDSAPLPVGTTRTDPQVNVVPAIAQASPDTTQADRAALPATTAPPESQPRAAPAVATGHSEATRGEKRTAARAAPKSDAASASQKRAAPATVAEAPVVVARADPAPATRASPRVIGNSRTSIYHLPDCPGFNKIRAEFRTEFASVQDAERAGYRRADNCSATEAASSR